jgi:beta-glucanase (GH16 family)
MRAVLTYILLITLTACPLYAESRQLVWSDEFDYQGLPDKTKWDYEVGFVRNKELQYYTADRKENARVENGMLVIEARKEEFKNPSYVPGAKGSWQKSRENAGYTSASLTTFNKASWRYGRIEVKAKLPSGRGMWPAIWMLGTNIRKGTGWPKCGEIDIMEFVGHEPDIIHGTIHTGKFNHVAGTAKGSRITIPGPDKDFHVYAVEWDPQKIDFFVDEKKYFTFKNDGTGEDAWPFDKEQYLILNIAVGGAWGGAKGVDDSIFPQKLYIDYVRVYQDKAPAKPQ